ncbi:MAG: N-acetyl-gamma-glutamyl-phosphate reductase [Nitriliruptoraceae bacterium]
MGTKRVGIVGASGYGGVELVRLLTAHPGFDVASVAAHSQAGTPVAQLFPNLAGSGVFDPIDIDSLARMDAVFLATPHDAAIGLAAELFAAGTPTIDLSAAFRLDADGFAHWYHEPHPKPELLQHAVYGLTEFARSEIVGSKLVANPGCYVITALLGLLPLTGLIRPGSVVIDGKSGTSGAGRAAKDQLHFSHVDGSITAYGAPTHRHTGEIERYLHRFGQADLGPVSFTPHLVPMPRGLLITAYAHLDDGVNADDIQQALVDRYVDEPFVHVLEPGVFPVTKAVVGSNACQVSAIVDERTQRVVVTSVTDNLGKGAAGSAIQNANLMMGYDETTGLSSIGVYP